MSFDFEGDRAFQINQIKELQKLLEKEKTQSIRLSSELQMTKSNLEEAENRVKDLEEKLNKEREDGEKFHKLMSFLKSRFIKEKVEELNYEQILISIQNMIEYGMKTDEGNSKLVEELKRKDTEIKNLRKNLEDQDHKNSEKLLKETENENEKELRAMKLNLEKEQSAHKHTQFRLQELERELMEMRERWRIEKEGFKSHLEKLKQRKENLETALQAGSEQEPEPLDRKLTRSLSALEKLRKMKEEQEFELEAIRKRYSRRKSSSVDELHAKFVTLMMDIPDHDQETVANQISGLLQSLRAASFPSKTCFGVCIKLLENQVDPEIIRELRILTEHMVDSQVHLMETPEMLVLLSQREADTTSRSFRDILLDKLASIRAKRMKRAEEETREGILSESYSFF